MSHFIDRPRTLCALGGAIAALKNINRAIPILHAAAGCGGNIANALNQGGGFQGSGYATGQALSSSNVSENEIVFGGEERLEEQIENTLKIMDGDLYVVLSACMVEMIGDDVVRVSRNFQRQGYPVLGADTGGFRGDAYKGYEIVLETLFQEYVEKIPFKQDKVVNLWGIAPIQDVFWEGNLLELKRILGRLEYQVNTFFGEGENLQRIKEAGRARLNIVASVHYGLHAAEVFAEEHGVPFLSLPFPVGITATEGFLRKVGAALEVESGLLESVIASEKEKYYHYVERISEAYNDFDLQRYAVVVGDVNYAPAVAKFIADDLGWLPELVVITDDLTDEEQEQILARIDGFESGLTPHIIFEQNTAEILRHINRVWPAYKGQSYYDAFSPAFVIGSTLERELAESLGAQFLSVSYPVSNRVVFDRAIAGNKGGISLAEDIFSAVLAAR